MRVISKFHDFYDAVQAQGQDRSLVFVRESHEVARAYREKQAPASCEKFVSTVASVAPGQLSLRQSSARYSSLTVSAGAVLLAGRLYPFAEALVMLRGSLASEPARVIYDLAELQQLLAEHDYDLEEKDRPRFSHWRGTQTFTWKEFFALSGSEQLLSNAVEQRLAILSWEARGDILRICPRLADLQFFRKLDAWQTHQELSMFLGNLAAPERNVVHIEDKYRIAQHGFDKWSFRRAPAGR